MLFKRLIKNPFFFPIMMIFTPSCLLSVGKNVQILRYTLKTGQEDVVRASA